VSNLPRQILICSGFQWNLIFRSLKSLRNQSGNADPGGRVGVSAKLGS